MIVFLAYPTILAYNIVKYQHLQTSLLVYISIFASEGISQFYSTFMSGDARDTNIPISLVLKHNFISQLLMSYCTTFITHPNASLYIGALFLHNQ